MKKFVALSTLVFSIISGSVFAVETPTQDGPVAQRGVVVKHESVSTQYEAVAKRGGIMKYNADLDHAKQQSWNKGAGH
ncbi:hypothetical protein AB4347_03005 [Vibrio breoganii]|uniref:hypothetical protein n=1 Tax=Vibrio breoganii TaxID=553239 RepID=UPI00080E092F|nr:hypothetical protein [Vibrio breoganii]OCH77432.1 hypothetical protein A6D95_06490 [Vibrio breoganii]PMG86028.1 hypothetical protein BCU81_11890 [Vibrio breoganii]PMI20086.1 hypothetical protein BCU49_08135 [Vibrio breoganii]PML21772.1 hypothetical protein BCT82_03040 [Vibrio breoganii]PMM47849.1 hypothetical protein BCT52_05650 [Vibrio breoganii]